VITSLNVSENKEVKFNNHLLSSIFRGIRYNKIDEIVEPEPKKSNSLTTGSGISRHSLRPPLFLPALHGQVIRISHYSRSIGDIMPLRLHRSHANWLSAASQRNSNQVECPQYCDVYSESEET